MGEKGHTMSGLDDYLAEPAAEEQEAETTPEPETGAEETQVAAETTEQKTAAEAEKGLQAALLAERRRRQELEAALHAKEEEEKPFLGEEYENRFKEVEGKFQQQLINQKLDLSEAFARDKYSDFQEKFDTFAEIVATDPQVYRQMVAQQNPAEFAYKYAANHLKAKEMGNPLEYEEKLKAKLTAEIEAKVMAKFEAEAKKRGELPISLADTRGTAGANAQPWTGPPPLKDLLA